MSERRFIQRFEVLEELGSGAMGTVIRARDPQLERDVAIKILNHATEPARDELVSRRTINLRDEASRDDLMHEARIMARLAHPNVVPVYEVGLDGTDVFVVMELVAGSDLREWLAEPRAAAAITSVLVQAGHGLAAAHAQGIVHRDFKPENVLIGRDGRARVADFGLSKLVVAPSAMMRVAEHGGTPKYMAPELWRGEPATPKSDVFAYCTVVAEALDDDQRRRLGVGAIVAAGLSEDPAARPEIAAVVRALERPRPRRRWVAAAAVAGVAASGLAFAFALRGAGDPCTDDPGLFARRWDDDTRASLGRALQPKPSAAARAAADRVLLILDDQRTAIATRHRGVCEARHRGELTDAQATRASSCLERRAMELAAFVHLELGARELDLIGIEDAAQSLTRPSVCEELAAPPLPADRAAVAALYDRYAVAIDRGPPAERRAALAALERDAAALGESEMQVRAALALGIRLRFDDELAVSDETLQKAYVRAHDIHDTNAEAVALVERSVTAGLRGDPTLTKTYVQLALDLADKPTTPARTRARIYAQLGRAERNRGNYPAAVDKLRLALEVIAKSGEKMTQTAIKIQTELVMSLAQELKLGPAVEGARQSLDYIRANVGEHSANYGIGLDALSFALRQSGKAEEAIAASRQGLAVLLEVYPPDHSAVLNARDELANALTLGGHWAEAREQIEAALAQTERNQVLRPLRADMEASLAGVLFNLGAHDDAIRRLEQAVEESTSQIGADHPSTLLYRSNLCAYRIELGQLDAAARDVEAIDQGTRSRLPSSDPRGPYWHGWLGSELAVARGKPRDAEAIARRGLAELAELKADDQYRRVVLWTLAESLVAQHRFEEAKPVLDEEIELGRKTNTIEAFAVLDDVLLAQVEYGLGQHAAGIKRAEHVRDVLAHVEGQPKARREIAAFLATHH